MFHVKHHDFDVVVIGGGHAGAEAAHTAARTGAKTALVTLSHDNIGVMSCNPAIGGLGKGHLVREIDALGGVMGLAADRSGIQFRLLNRRKGPAVQGPRTQSDRKLYRAAMQDLLARTKNLTIIAGEAADFLGTDDAVSGVVLADGAEISARSVVLTTGTFLRGVIHIGDKSMPGGRMGDRPSVKLAQRIDSFALPLGRLKTGTPPRLDGRTINWDILETQPADDDPVLFSFLSNKPYVRQISCAITHTNEKTHEIIRDNLSRSAMYGGHIEGIGPRYCPSIEDKIVRFSDKTSHQVFLEPEGLEDHTIYPNGISTSLPTDVQVDYVRSMVGLEAVEILQPGYAIEYDFVDPRALGADLQVKTVKNLYFAGQINGTTGYEEAAAQGFVAGVNAARSAQGRDAVIFSRRESYIGVMIDDLVIRGVSEPYRMFTSRAEFRLSLRADNADQRLTPLGIDLGTVDETRKRLFEGKMAQIDDCYTVLRSHNLTPSEGKKHGLNMNQDGQRRNGVELLAFPDIEFSDLEAIWPELVDHSVATKAQINREAQYAAYIERQERDVQALKRDEAQLIPEALNFMEIEGLSTELRQKLSKVQPRDLGQAGRIDGMTPAALTLILTKLRQIQRKSA
ncbi:tRNA uridine-5-carboxymethylaminomethyl(34) synthesis enzyme MnmG [Rhodobacterales bacterium LSUCC0387]|nr:tRNA uridine-5-carboxymethylaminomethyl(34) synthesis enzyme MnmG [Rhodobacterales bacterium LSUCC0387]